VAQKKYPLNQAANEVFNGKTCPAAIYEIYSIAQTHTLEELIERLVFVEKVEKGLEQIKEGKTVPHEQVKDMIKKW
jgi:hypothetical protein